MARIYGVLKGISIACAFCLTRLILLKVALRETLAKNLHLRQPFDLDHLGLGALDCNGGESAISRSRSFNGQPKRPVLAANLRQRSQTRPRNILYPNLDAILNEADTILPSPMVLGLSGQSLQVEPQIGAKEAEVQLLTMGFRDATISASTPVSEELMAWSRRDKARQQIGKINYYFYTFKGSKQTPSKTEMIDLTKPLDSFVHSSKSLKRTCLSPASIPKHSCSKRRKITQKSIELERDPYELSGDENSSPIPFPTTTEIAVPSAKPVISKTTGDKKRKFFITRTPEIPRQPNMSSLESKQRKHKTVLFLMQTKRVPKLMSSRTRSQPLTDDERARIAATTIWLPLPNQPPSSQQPKSAPIEENNDVIECAGGSGDDDWIGTEKPTTADPCSTPLRKLSEKPLIRTSDNGDYVQPFSDVSNVLVSSVKRRNVAENETTGHQEVRRISFAQPLSPIPKRDSNSRGSSGQSASGLKIPRRHRSQDEDQSNYEEWLKEFSSQLKPFEDFDLTID
ncbi:unnamed protein product [Rodentolepis nana]|uniref:Non-specific serine/threonine protein kinase n=1 Tax=Rodentolepis nana TaxID=102285 RepID=A0A0R3T6U4_RODNA|nr:unnamed protein product [Rodentolepis nana]